MNTDVRRLRGACAMLLAVGLIPADEDGKADRHNPGGGHIPTIVITNHGPRGLTDPTPYDHYSLLRTVEDALGLGEHLRHAGDAAIHPMTPLFATN